MDNSGRTLERYQNEVAGLEDVVVDFKGLKAWVSAHHFQVLIPKKVIIEVLSEMLEEGWSDQMMGRMVEMDDRMDARGYLRLTTYAQTMRLLGNTIDDEVKALAARDGVSTTAAISGEETEKSFGFWSNRLVRRLSQAVINRLYHKLHQEDRS